MPNCATALRYRSLLSSLPLLFTLLLTQCKAPQRTSAPADVATQQTMGAGATTRQRTPKPNAPNAPTTPVWLSQQQAPEQPSRTKAFRLLHTRLDLTPNWATESLDGDAHLVLTPWFHPQDSICLDAKWLQLHAVNLEAPTGRLPLPYHHTPDSLQIVVALDGRYHRGDTLRLHLQYTAHPNRVRLQSSESIMDARGLYFINADKQHPYKPLQLWTQGQPESASCWFPTLDDPGQRSTQEVYLTVADSLQTLSNGALISSTHQPGNLRTDYWRMDLPHAPYLFMVAAGVFAQVTDHWEDVPVSYFLEPAYAPYARLVFGNTPEMITFYSTVFGIPFPWAKYAQMVVQDFVSGAMENTTATLHNSDLQHDARAHLDDTEEDYISHELVHQWVGNLVTCESWSQLALNEGLTTYGEYLWREYKYGSHAADASHHQNRENYLAEASGKREPLIRCRHHHAGDMFDHHSYGKGGCVFHQLRRYLGDDAFFAGLRLYLQRHAFQAVEVHHLRLAYEDVVGQDLTWFFNQWFLERGHPELRVRYAYDPAAQAVHIRLRQTQDTLHQPLYQLHLDAQIEATTGSITQRLHLHTADTTFVIPCPAPSGAALADSIVTLPAFVQNVRFDAEYALLGEWDEEKPPHCWLHQLASPRQHYAAVHEALSQLATAPQHYARTLPPAVWQWTHTPERSLAVHALQCIDRYHTTQAQPFWLDSLAHLSQQAADAAVRNEALMLLSAHTLTAQELRTPAEVSNLKVLLQTSTQDSSYQVVATALSGLQELDSTLALSHALQCTTLLSADVQTAVADILLAANHPTANAHVVDMLWRIPGYGRFYLLNTYRQHLKDRTDDEVTAALDVLKYTAARDNLSFMRLTAARCLSDLKARRPELQVYLEQLYAREHDPKLKSVLKLFTL